MTFSHQSLWLSVTLSVCMYTCVILPLPSVATYCTFNCARYSINEDDYLSAEGQYDDRNQCH